jgi:hypothetical protein
VGGEDAAHPGSDATIHHGDKAPALGQFVEREGVLREESDIDDVLSRLQDGAESLKSEKTRHGADDHVRSMHGLLDSRRVRKVGSKGLEAADVPELGQGLGVDVDRQDLRFLVGRQVFGHRASDQAGA